MLQPLRILLMATIVVTCARYAAPTQAAVTAAFIDFDRTPLGTAMEAKLLAAADVRWVERAQLDLIVQENRLQAAFSPDGGAARLELGRLLQADALALLRKRKPIPGRSQSEYDLVVCETRRGLRLASLVLTEESTKPLDATQLADRLLARLRTADRPIRLVYTVPPLSGRDLSYRYSHLQRGYAELLSQRLLEQPGVAVVETAEARAIAQERTLAAAAGAVDGDFAAPIFITGEFRHSGAADALRIRLQLTADRGSVAVGAALDTEVPSTDAPQTLLAWIDEVSAAAGSAKPAPVDRDAEAERFYTRGRDLLTWNNLDEAWAIAEAGLLFNPDDLPLRRLAFDAVSAIYHKEFLICRVEPSVWPRLRIAFLRACDHLEFLASHDGKMSISIPSTPYWAMSFFGMLGGVRMRPDAEAQAILDELKPIEADVLVRLFKIRVARGFHADAHHFLARYLQHLTPERRHTEIIKHVLEYPQGPDAAIMAGFIIHGQFSNTASDKNPKLAILRELKTHTERPDLVRVAEMNERETLRQMAAQEQVSKDDAAADALPFGGFAEPFHVVEWKIQRVAQGKSLDGEVLEPYPSNGAPLKYICVGAQLDVARNDRELFWVRRPGVLEPFLTLDRSQSFNYYSELCFDGRYLWTCAGSHSGPRTYLIVVDPQSGRIWNSPNELALPDAPAEMTSRSAPVTFDMVSLGPGEVFAVATRDRTHLVRVRFDPNAAEPFSFTTVYECPEVGDQAEKEVWRNPRLSFSAGSLAAIPKPDGKVQAKHVLIVRKNRFLGMDSHPLLVDLTTGSVEVIEKTLKPDDGNGIRSAGVCLRGDRVLFAQRYLSSGMPIHLMEFHPATKKLDIIDDDSPGGYLFFTGEEMHLLGHTWWRKKPGDERFSKIDLPLPWKAFGFDLSGASRIGKREYSRLTERHYALDAFYPSAHYGLLLRINRPNAQRWSRFHYLQVALPSPVVGRP